MSNSYKQTLDMLRTERDELTGQRDSLNSRIAALTRSIEGLEVLCDESDHSAGLLPESNADQAGADLGISDAIRKFLSDSPLSVPDIRDSLVQVGFDPAAYSNILTVIHNTLRRLDKQGQAHPVTTPGGTTKWVAGPGRTWEQPKSHWVSRALGRNARAKALIDEHLAKKS
jgi:hypothetical protein